MSHTPGPWYWAGTFPIRIIDAQGYVVCDGILPSGDGNAHLIAAAPELLAAVRYLLDNADDYSAEGIERCRAAVSKATGSDT